MKYNLIIYSHLVNYPSQISIQDILKITFQKISIFYVKNKSNLSQCMLKCIKNFNFNTSNILNCNEFIILIRISIMKSTKDLLKCNKYDKNKNHKKSIHYQYLLLHCIKNNSIVIVHCGASIFTWDFWYFLLLAHYNWF